MACFVYEGVVLFGIMLVPGAFGAVMVAGFGERFALEHGAVLQIFAFVFFGAYFMGFWVLRGQTLPMLTWHIQLQSRSGERLGWGRAAVRYLASWIWVAPPALAGTLLQLGLTHKLTAIAAWIGVYASLALLHPQRQFWHDALCGTRLVTHRPQRRT